MSVRLSLTPALSLSLSPQWGFPPVYDNFRRDLVTPFMRSRCTRKRENCGDDEFLVSCRQLLASVTPADGFPGPAIITSTFHLGLPRDLIDARTYLSGTEKHQLLVRFSGVSAFSLHFHNRSRRVATHPPLPFVPSASGIYIKHM